MLIPTRYRDRLSKDFSYPVGAEALSAALRGVPQFGKLSVAFTWARQPGSPASVRQAAGAGEAARVLVASYRHLVPGHGASRALLQEGFYDPDWSLSVYAVMSESRSAVRALLLSDGLAMLRLWLTAPRSEMWLIGRRTFVLDFSHEQETLSVSQASDL